MMSNGTIGRQYRSMMSQWVPLESSIQPGSGEIWYWALGSVNISEKAAAECSCGGSLFRPPLLGISSLTLSNSITDSKKPSLRFSGPPWKYKYNQIEVRYGIKHGVVWICIKNHNPDTLADALFLNRCYLISHCCCWVIAVPTGKSVQWYFQSCIWNFNMDRYRWDMVLGMG